MKKVFSAIILFCASDLFAQEPAEQTSRFRSNLYATYAFPDKFDSHFANTSYYEGKVNGGLLWGAGIEYLLRPSQGFEPTYLRTDTKMPLTYDDGKGAINSINTGDFNVAVNYFLLGTTRYLKVNPILEPYFGIHFGFAALRISNDINDNTTSGAKFAWGLKAGTNVWAFKKAGFKVQAGLISVAQAIGGNIYFGPNGGASELTSFSSVYQFVLGGGFVFKTGK